MSDKIRMLVELELHGDYGQAGADESEREWFRNHLLGDGLLLHSVLIGDSIGSVKVLSIAEDIT